MLDQDKRVDFGAYFVAAKTKTEMRRTLVEVSLSWIRLQRARGARGAVMLDIDDTLIDGKECVQNGFQCMRELYQELSLYHPIHIVTARPDDNHDLVLRLLKKRGFSIPTDRLHMLPAHLWGIDGRHVEDFKWKVFLEIAESHGGAVARFGDKMWDVAHRDSLDSYLSHVPDKACYIFMDPRLRGTMSAKLPG